ncbi:MAG: NADH-quinone oxidoreductase subunit NuoF [Pseudomonadales bacterium]|jgi:NADH-quinone oxidoreductase subunit F|nr:NADH-quinone oxidoreductase subunit NuoF [Pseudomonadales bacterium]MDP6472698.1 NADH-quinone oxidoreductase subunit NuoF [Pseudomonadales bacterium]MDP6827909.1 NADH-quinone oxidoreductase subunit NuoF [Pseudomonadales bacterium]MDP6973507.1 NADH-quinone oxidoreductase subunit NuoF [Pseudomonadales bacterium]
MSERPLTERIDAAGGFVDGGRYEEMGGYVAARQAVTSMTPQEVCGLVKDANLRGRGGAGFPTGVKWGFVPDVPGRKYLVCNADEMEPGTFKDRYLMENDPHLLVEGMIIAAYAIGADRAYVFLRGEYHESYRALTAAIGEAHANGCLGESVFGTTYALELAVHRSGGRYICGEETALLNALEGKRAQPRTKPPFPPASGAWGRPTIVNNVETLCNVPAIIRRGAEWYQSLGLGEDSGTKIYGVSGRVKRPGLWELPMGTPIREIIEQHAGGMCDGYRLRGLLPGGASTDFLVEEHLDLAMEYGAIQAAGSRMGTGTMILMDDHVCPVDMARNLQHFFAQESCGFCTPCREGLPWVEQLLLDIEEGRGTAEDLELLDHNAAFIGAPGNTFCLHATGAIEPLMSALKYFREDFEAHIREHGCPYRSGPGSAAEADDGAN